MPWPLYRAFSHLVDELTISVCILVEQERGFARTRGAPPSVEELLAEVRARPPRLAWPERVEGRTRVRVDAPSTGQRTFFDVHPTPGADTLVVYHHGLGEVVHDVVPRSLARSPVLGRRCAWVALKGFHHADFLEVSARLTACRHHFTRCLMASAAIADQVARWGRERYRHVVLCGISMGGVISLIDAAEHRNYDLYVPFVAGPDLGDVTTRSAFARTVQGAFLRRARRGERWTRDLDLTARLAAAPGPPIRPLLARSDRLFRHERQTAAYERIPRARVRSFEGGHITGAANVVALARHLRRAIDETCWATRPAPRPTRPATTARAASD